MAQCEPWQDEEKREEFLEVFGLQFFIIWQVIYAGVWVSGKILNP